MAGIRIDWAAVERMLHSPTGMVGRDLQRRAGAVAAEARRTAPGSMPSRITGPDVGRRGTDLSASITSNHHATIWVTQGTRPHQIRPVRARALRFTVGGRIVFAKHVNHPGNRAADFMNKALHKALH